MKTDCFWEITHIGSGTVSLHRTVQHSSSGQKNTEHQYVIDALAQSIYTDNIFWLTDWHSFSNNVQIFFNLLLIQTFQMYFKCLSNLLQMLQLHCNYVYEIVKSSILLQTPSLKHLIDKRVSYSLSRYQSYLYFSSMVIDYERSLKWSQHLI